MPYIDKYNKMEELSTAEKYYRHHQLRMKEYYEKNKEEIALRRRQKRLEKNPNIFGRGKFNAKNMSPEMKEKLSPSITNE